MARFKSFQVSGETNRDADGRITGDIMIQFDDALIVEMGAADAVEIAAQLLAAAIKTSTMSAIYAALVTADVSEEVANAMMSLAAATPDEMPPLVEVLKRWGGRA